MVVRPVLVPLALVLALAAGGCSLSGARTSGNKGSFTGTQGDVAATVNAFSSDASSNNASAICSNILSSAALARIARAGACKTIITDQLKTINDFTLTIEDIHVNGDTATAHVQTKQNGKKVIQPITLVHESGGWRIESFE
jgi:hypothetical protein